MQQPQRGPSTTRSRALFDFRESSGRPATLEGGSGGEFTNIREVAGEKKRLRVKRELRERATRQVEEPTGQSFSNSSPLHFLGFRLRFNYRPTSHPTARISSRSCDRKSPVFQYLRARLLWPLLIESIDIDLGF